MAPSHGVQGQGLASGAGPQQPWACTWGAGGRDAGGPTRYSRDSPLPTAGTHLATSKSAADGETVRSSSLGSRKRPAGHPAHLRPWRAPLPLLLLCSGRGRSLGIGYWAHISLPDLLPAHLLVPQLQSARGQQGRDLPAGRTEGGSGHQVGTVGRGRSGWAGQGCIHFRGGLLGAAWEAKRHTPGPGLCRPGPCPSQVPTASAVCCPAPGNCPPPRPALLGPAVPPLTPSTCLAGCETTGVPPGASPNTSRTFSRHMHSAFLMTQGTGPRSPHPQRSL